MAAFGPECGDAQLMKAKLSEYLTRLTVFAAAFGLAEPALAATAQAPAERIKAFCVDFNWGAKGFAPPGMYAEASAREHVEWYKKLGVNTIQTFCVSCPGYAWYQSKVAPPQPGMKGEFLKEITKRGHAAGLRVMGYFCIGGNAWWSERHPDQVHPIPNAISIPLTKEYLGYLERIIPEALKRTGIDGFMIDWVFSPMSQYPDKKYTWLNCEQQMYWELFDEAFPGAAAMDKERTNEFNRRAVERCWRVIHAAAKRAKPDCIIWLSCYDLQHPQMQGCSMLKEADWVMNEHFDPAKLEAVRGAVGPHTKLIQCLCGWGKQHNAEKILHDERFAQFGVYGFAKPDPKTTLPPEDGSANARNIAAMRAFFNAVK